MDQQQVPKQSKHVVNHAFKHTFLPAKFIVSGEKESGPYTDMNIRKLYWNLSVTWVNIVPIMDLISA